MEVLLFTHIAQIEMIASRSSFSIVLFILVIVSSCTLLRFNSTHSGDQRVIESYKYVADNLDTLLTSWQDSVSQNRRVVVLDQFDMPRFSTFLASICARRTEYSWKYCAFPQGNSLARRLGVGLRDSIETIDRNEQQRMGVYKARHDDRIERLKTSGTLPIVENWPHQTPPDTAVAIRFGPIYRPKDVHRSLFPADLYVMGSVQYDISNVIGEAEPTEFMIGFDESGRRKHVYFHRPWYY